MAMLNNQMVIPRRTILCSHLALRDFDPVNRDHPGDQIQGALGKGLPKKCSATEWGATARALSTSLTAPGKNEMTNRTGRSLFQDKQ